MPSASLPARAPARLGRLSSRGTPVAALCLSTIGIALATAVHALWPATSFTIMMAISMFGAMFTWMMIFVTHLYFRRQHEGEALAFRMWGYPWTSLLGAGLMLAILVTTAFTDEFRMTLVYGLPMLGLLTGAWRMRGTTEF